MQEIYERHKEEDKKSGRRFNLYSIAKIEKDEVATHSRFIAELLNPKGSHGQGGVFLKLFLERLGIDGDVENASVHVETSYTGSGRVDIEISLCNHHIIIENKIDALDQPEQLFRYSEIAKTKKPYTIVYLTKYGSMPSDDSLKNKDDWWINQDSYQDGKRNLKLISYREDIVCWLEECIKESESVANVREGVTQYLNLVKKITKLERYLMMDNIIDYLMEDKDKLTLAAEVEKAFKSNELRGRLLFDFFEKLSDKLYSTGKYKLIIYEELSENNQSLSYKDSSGDSSKCSKWFKDKKNRHKGFFVDIDAEPFYLHVQVADDYLHYGLVEGKKGNDDKFEFGKSSNESNDKLAECLKNYNLVDQKWDKIKWYSKSVVNIRSFDTEAVELLTKEEKIEKLKSEIIRLVGCFKDTPSK